MKATVALVLALVCLAPAAHGSSFSASLLKIEWSSLTGTPAVLSYTSASSADTFELTADSVLLESDWKRELVVAEAGHETHPTTTDIARYGPSSWLAQSRSADASLFLIPSETVVQASKGSGTASLPTEECQPQPWYFEGPRPRACLNTKSAIQLRADASRWLVTGNFTIVLWAWQGSIAASDGASEFWSGSQATEASLTGIGETELRQAFLQVINGSLQLNLGTTGKLGLYAEALAFATTTVTTQNQTGDLYGTFAEGQLHLQRGDWPPVEVATTSIARTRQLWPVGILGASVLLVSLSLLHVRRQQALVHLVLAKKNLEMENHHAAARHASKAARASDQKVEANVLGAIAAMKAQDFDRAKRFLRKLHALREHDEAACRFLRAHLRIQQGHAAEGQELLEECLALDPTYSLDAAASPVLAPFLDPSKWPRTVE